MNGEVRAVYAKPPTQTVSITSMNGEVVSLFPKIPRQRAPAHPQWVHPTDFGEDASRPNRKARAAIVMAKSTPLACTLMAARMEQDTVHAAMRVAQDVRARGARAVQEEADNDTITT